MEYYDDRQQRTVKRVFACFDRRTMDELARLKSSPTPSPGQRVRNQQGELNTIRNRRNALQEAFLALSNRLNVTTPAIDTVEETVVYLGQTESETEDAAADPPCETEFEPSGDHAPDERVPSPGKAADKGHTTPEERSAGAETPATQSEEHVAETEGDQASEHQLDKAASADVPDNAASLQDPSSAQPQQSTLAELLRQRRAQRNQQ